MADACIGLQMKLILFSLCSSFWGLDKPSHPTLSEGGGRREGGGGGEGGGGRRGGREGGGGREGEREGEGEGEGEKEEERGRRGGEGKKRRGKRRLNLLTGGSSLKIENMSWQYSE